MVFSRIVVGCSVWVLGQCAQCCGCCSAGCAGLGRSPPNADLGEGGLVRHVRAVTAIAKMCLIQIFSKIWH